MNLRWLVVVSLFLAQAVLPSSVVAQRRAFLSEDVAGPLGPRSVVADPLVLRSRRATVDLTLLSAAGIGPLRAGSDMTVAARSVELNLFADVNLIAQLDRVETVATIGYAWVGQVAGVEGSRVILAVADGVLSASVTVLAQTYSIKSLGDGNYLVAESDRTAIPKDLEGRIPPTEDGIAEQRTADAADSGSQYDLLMYYTTTAKNVIGGTTAVNALITASIAQVNAVYVSSNIATRVRLVAAVEVGYTETGNLETDLDTITTGTAGASFRAGRDTYGADLVSLLVSKDDPTASGIGWVTVVRGVASPEYAYSVVAYYNSLGYIYALAHELGHNQGSLHEPGNNGGRRTTGAYTYSLGYTDTVHKFYDVMSYGTGCGRGCVELEQFSSPINTYRGFPVGTATQDNVLSITNTRDLIANYRLATVTTPPTLPVLVEPTNLTVSAVGSTVTIRWSAPATGTPTSYIIEAGSLTGLADLATLDTANTATTYAADRVTDGVYYIRVKAKDSVTTTAASNEAAVSVGRGCSGAPPPPSGLSVVVAGRTVLLSWAAAATASTYVLQAGSQAGGSNLFNADLGSALPSISAPGVSPGTYFVRVRGKNPCGTGNASNEVTAVVP